MVEGAARGPIHKTGLISKALTSNYTLIRVTEELIELDSRYNQYSIATSY